MFLDIAVMGRVWVGQNVQISKGASIGADSVIGAEAIVTEAIPPNRVAAGSPARVVRCNVRWCHEFIPSATRDVARPESA
jgi:acetyltransferase-like isoleucine patch superfamily enzyme